MRCRAPAVSCRGEGPVLEATVVQHFDAIVVGAGPAGSNAARLLAQAGVRVALLEKHALPRYKTCGGGVVRRALQWAPGDIEKALAVQSYRARLTFSDLEQQFLLEEEAPLIHLTMRQELDHELAMSAQRAGAQLLESCAFRAAERQQHVWRVGTSQGVMMAPILIGADGAQSRVARSAGWSPNPACIPALEWEIKVDDATLARLSGEVRFDFDVGLRGYAWVFPKGDSLSVGLLSTARGKRDLSGALQRYLDRLHIQPRQVERHGATLPIAPRSKRLAGEGVFLVGDAAGLVDPITCEGISASLQSASLVAQALTQTQFEAVAAARQYHRELRGALLDDLRWARRLSHVLYSPRPLRQLLFRRFGQTFCNLMGDVISGRRSYRSLLSHPSRYLRLLSPSAGSADR
jgi:geranylgeranyl reductase family protein